MVFKSAERKEAEVKTDRGYYLLHWETWPLPVISIPDVLNPFKSDGVDISIVIGYHLPYENIKFISVLGLLFGAEDSGMLRGVHTLVEATSGNTGIVLAILAKFFGVLRVKLVVPPDLPEGKRHPLVMAGAELIPPENGLSCVATARKMGGGGWRSKGWSADNGVLNLDQYGNLDGTRLHRNFTAPSILKGLVHPPTVLVAGIGTSGTLIGIGQGLRDADVVRKLTTVGILLKSGQEIPGVRDLDRMKEIILPWRAAADEVVEVETCPSYLASSWFNWVMGITPGPSSGFAYLGALKFLQAHRGELDQFRDDDGRIRVVILFPDGNRPYGERFMANLSTGSLLQKSTAPLPWKFPGSELW